jgi:hypothetical protein
VPHATRKGLTFTLLASNQILYVVLAMVACWHNFGFCAVKLQKLCALGAWEVSDLCMAHLVENTYHPHPVSSIWSWFLQFLSAFLDRP